MNREPSLADALAAFHRANGLPPDESAARSWACHVGPLALRLPNFTWRRRAIHAHDLHHVLTGYPCTLRGEFQVAAWEFGAGPMPHWGARLFCLPLMLIGLFWSPRRIWQAYRGGRMSSSLHGRAHDDLLSAPISIARREIRGRTRRQGMNVLSFAWLIAEASLLLLGPLAIGVLLAVASSGG